MLTLTIKKKWFNMILSGEKEEEYREIKPYYNSRLPVNFGYVFIDGKLQPIYRFDCNLQKSIEAGHETEILFRNGYRKDSPSFIAKCTLHIGKGREEWGAEKGEKYFVLKIYDIF